MSIATDDDILNAVAFTHAAVCDTHKVDGTDGFAEFFDSDSEGAAGVVYYQGKWYDALITVDLVPYSDEDDE